MDKQKPQLRRCGIRSFDGEDDTEDDGDGDVTLYDLGAKMIEAIGKEKVRSGDVVAIDKASGKITKLGRSFARSRDCDVMGSRVKFVQCPDGELQKRREVMHCVSLHEIDVINSSGDTCEIRAEVRDQIDTKVAEWREEGKAEIMPGSVFVGTGETAEISTQFGNFDVLPDVTTDHHFLITKEIPQLSDQTSLIIMKEWNNLSKNLPESIYVRVYGTRIDLLRDVIIGPSGTPYHDGLFFFDISLPADYPLQLPKVYYHAHGYSLNPNLYENGMVCLSLINTWPADKESKWRTKSTILQLLVSLQGLHGSLSRLFVSCSCTLFIYLSREIYAMKKNKT